MALRSTNQRRVLLVIAGAAALALAVGLAIQRRGYAAADRSLEVDEEFVQATAKVRVGVVAIGTYWAKDTPTIHYFGSGFVILDGRTVVTNEHVISAIQKSDRIDYLRVFFPDSNKIEGRVCTIAGMDDDHDVAILTLDGPAATPLEVNTDEPPQGRTCGVLGFPIGMQLGLVPAVHKGVVAATVPAVLPLPKGTKMTPELAEKLKRPFNIYQLDLLAFPGNSGSPLFDGRDGKVIGIVNKVLATKTREHLLDQPSAISYAVPIQFALDLVKKSSARSGE